MRFELGTIAALALTSIVATGQQQDATVFDCCNNGISPPTVVKSVKPDYTPEAIAARIEGVVWVSIVVTGDGTVSDVKVTRSLDTKYGLDEQAVKATRLFEFRPGMKDGKPVAVRVTVELTFTLK